MNTKRGSVLAEMNGRERQRTTWLSMLGAVVNVPNGRRMAALAARCNHSATIYAKAKPKKEDQRGLKILRDWQRKQRRARNRWAATQFVALFGGALEELDAAPFENFAKIIRAIKAHNMERQHAHPFHTKALALADVIRFENDLESDEALPVTQLEFLARLGTLKKEHDDGSYERRELKRLEIRFREGKRGRKKGTRKLQT